MNVQLSTDVPGALPLLALAGRFDANGGGATVAEMAGGQAVFDVFDQGRRVAAFALGVHDYADGRVIRCGAAGAEPGHQVLPAMVAFTEDEARRLGARAILCETRRRGLVRQLQRQGFRVAGFILRKDV